MILNADTRKKDLDFSISGRGRGRGRGRGAEGCCGDEIDTEKPDPENLRHFDTPIKLRLLIPKKYAKVFSYSCAVIEKLMLD